MKIRKALNDYANAMKLGNTRTLPHLFRSADIRLSFDKEHIGNLVGLVKDAIGAFCLTLLSDSFRCDCKYGLTFWKIWAVN